MSERKIRLTLSSTLHNGVGALIDVDFNNENLDVDIDVDAEHGISTLVKEYTVDVEPGTYNLDISYKNDVADDINKDGFMEIDRNLVIEKIEFSGNGVDYENLLVNPSNSTLLESNYYYIEIQNTEYNPELPKSAENHPWVLNPEFDESLPATDSDRDINQPPGLNSWFSYNLVINPIIIYNSSTVTFQITFV